ncbi:MAG: acyl-CoA dehydratase activase-related protein [Treponema sp.]
MIFPFRIGIDIGSTTVKIVVLDSLDNIIFSSYTRHRSDIRSTMITSLEIALKEIEAKNGENAEVSVIATGSGGLGISEALGIPFIQEVTAATKACQMLKNQPDVVIELGGEDAKITYFQDGNTEQRMNSSCAGGTGAFIDQMAALLETDAKGLNELAKNATTVYPIAARCGVFAKTDIQPLINEGARREDIAKSIFQAVVVQTISGLACGKPIRRKVAFLGGPLHFLSELKKAFIDTLKLKQDEVIEPENSEVFVALGSALSIKLKKIDAQTSFILKSEKSSVLQTNEKEKSSYQKLKDFKASLYKVSSFQLTEVKRLTPLFKNEEELKEFKERHKKHVAKKKMLESATGSLFLGLDAGSTTTKAVLIDAEGNVLWSFYDVNQGNPIAQALLILKTLYNLIPSSAYIAYSCSTGYGEKLFQVALGVDIGEVETIAHYKAASFFLPGVEFLLDIGGQDMKALQIKNGVISSIQLNEACSSGCGSFLDNFARSLGLTIEEFSKLALLAKEPVDLGSRCTVFMNSRVKQAQKEGSSVGDISSGLSYSVIKNALFKVIKLRNTESIGKKIIVQGGTFNNDAVLRAFELIAEKEAVRPDISGLMGSYGAALIAKDTWERKEKPKTTLASLSSLENFDVKLDLTRCKRCQNNCMLTVNTFYVDSIKRLFVTGNRCERGREGVEKDLGLEKKVSITKEKVPNIFKWKAKRVMDYKKLSKNEALRGEIGIPRILNMWENYPFWFTFFTKLGFSVVLSPPSSHAIYEMGLESIPSESVCYPAKISHGAIEALLKAGIKTIFYPCVPFEKKEDAGANNHYNCPIVTSYSETLRNNIEALRQDSSVTFFNFFVPYYNKKLLTKSLFEELSKKYKLSFREVKKAVDEAWKEAESFKKETEARGEEVLKEIEEKNLIGIVLAGRPYHLDPELNHGIPEMIEDLGVAVLTEDSIAHLGKVERPLRVVDQWSYHNRLYRAASFVATKKNLELVQLTSFGCGLDAVTQEQVQEILEKKNKMYTLIKIDEGANLGAIRIRIRSLLSCVEERKKDSSISLNSIAANFSKKILFTKEMAKRYTILGPQMSPIHFDLLEKAFECSGFNLEILDNATPSAIDVGIKYVNNDACYPAIIVAGQMIEALQSGRYNLNETALIITQTGGGCRATNYIGFIRKALADANLSHVPVIALSHVGIEKHPGFKLTPRLIDRALKTLCLGDLLMRVLYRVRPYEREEGASNRLYKFYANKIKEEIKNMNRASYHRIIKEIVTSFDSLPLKNIKKPRVGVVGEILVNFHPLANNDIFSTIEKEGAECVVPDLVDFFLYTLYSGIYKNTKLEHNFFKSLTYRLGIAFIESYRGYTKKILKKSHRFSPMSSIYELAKSVDDILQLGNMTGEGWFLTAKMIELIKMGVPNIACVQPFACLPNHVTGKGMIKELRRRYKNVNISPIDFDPGASEVNQLNRLKLLLSNAKIGEHPDGV